MPPWKLQEIPAFLIQSPFLNFAHRAKIKKYDVSTPDLHPSSGKDAPNLAESTD